MRRVFPGVPDTFAKPFMPVSIFTNDDLPTLLRPMNAISLSVSFGTCDMRSELHLNFAFTVVAIAL